MKLQDFLNMKPGMVVKIGKRKATLIDAPNLGGGIGLRERRGCPAYGWAHFRYESTGKKVTKRNRQVEFIPDKPVDINKIIVKTMIRAGRDGGNGEFEKYVPDDLKKESLETGASFMPRIDDKGNVVWDKVF